MVGRLSEFFRNTLTADPTTLVPLATELDMIEDYLAIEAVRFGDRLHVEINVDAGSMPAQVPGFVLQPLVENAIKYGVSATTKPVAVEIVARRSGTSVQLSIVNDVPEGAASIRSGTGLGLVNVRERLRRAFGDAAACASGMGEDGRFSVTLSIPLE